MTSVPSNIGQSSHGKLKADQWRALGTTHLLLSLIRLWVEMQILFENCIQEPRCGHVRHANPFQTVSE
jgi:hypothetical protein